MAPTVSSIGVSGSDAVLVVEVDHVDAEPLEAALAGLANVVRRAVDAANHRLGRIADDAELGREHHLARRPFDRLPTSSSLVVRPVHVGGVEERAAEIERAVDRRDRLTLVARAVELGHAHAAEADGRRP
jgi:hypothetical protein